MRFLQAEAHSLRNDLDSAKLQHMRLQEAAAAAEEAAAAAQRQLEAQREGEGVVQVGGWVGGTLCMRIRLQLLEGKQVGGFDGIMACGVWGCGCRT